MVDRRPMTPFARSCWSSRSSSGGRPPAAGGQPVDLVWTAWAAHHLGDLTTTAATHVQTAGASVLLVVERAERWLVDDL
jgi:hypothetical protein